MPKQISNLDPSFYVTEKEKSELFEKLKKITELLFGIHVQISEEKNTSTSCQIVDKKINFCFGITDYSQSCTLDTQKNIDSFDYIDSEKIKEIPMLLVVFFHEISHLLTINNPIEYFNNRWSWRKSHREYPYEKLADNLAYNFIGKNYDVILGILIGKDVTIAENIIQENLDLANKYKEKYIFPKAFMSCEPSYLGYGLYV
jgi:hypothetical protein